MPIRPKSDELLVDVFKNAASKEEFLAKIEATDYSLKSDAMHCSILHYLAHSSGLDYSAFPIRSEQDRIEIFNYMVEEGPDRFPFDFTEVSANTMPAEVGSDQLAFTFTQAGYNKTPIEIAFAFYQFALVKRWIEYSDYNLKHLKSVYGDKLLKRLARYWDLCRKADFSPQNSLEMQELFSRMPGNLIALFHVLYNEEDFATIDASRKTHFQRLITRLATDINKPEGTARFCIAMRYSPLADSLEYTLKVYYQLAHIQERSRNSTKIPTLPATLSRDLIQKDFANRFSKLLICIKDLLKKGAAINANFSYDFPDALNLSNQLLLGTTINGKPITSSQPNYQYAITNSEQLKNALCEKTIDRQEWIENCKYLKERESDPKKKATFLSILAILNYYHFSNNQKNTLTEKCLIALNSNSELTLFRKIVKYSETNLATELRDCLHVEEEIDGMDEENSILPRCNFI